MKICVVQSRSRKTKRVKKKNSLFSNHEDGNREGTGEEGHVKLFIPEVYSVATCTSSQKNVIIRCMRDIAWKPNDSGRVRRRMKHEQAASAAEVYMVCRPDCAFFNRPRRVLCHLGNPRTFGFSPATSAEDKKD